MKLQRALMTKKKMEIYDRYKKLGECVECFLREDST